MRRPQLIKKESEEVGTIANLASVFEGLASMEVGKIRDHTLSSKSFFLELWEIYSQLRVKKSRLNPAGHRADQRELFVAITSQGGLSGDIDSQVIDYMLHFYDARTTDIFIVGNRGAVLLDQRGVEVKRNFPLPDTREGFGISVIEPIIAEMANYKKTTAFYQVYVSLAKQEVAKIEVILSVKALGEAGDEARHEIISEQDYEFEPTLEAVVDYLESIMLGIVLSQVILESTLSQAASRFNAMGGAKQRATELLALLRLTYNRAKRATNEERTREIIAVLANKKR